MKKEVIGVIPVKGSSERVKQKNLRPFADTNLYELKLKQLQSAKGFADLIVSSENENVLDTAKKYGFNVHIRDSKYSTSQIPMSEVYSNIASEIDGEHIAWINVTNPLAESDNYTLAIQKYETMPEYHDCLLSVYEIKDYFFYRGKPINFKPYPWAKSQDLEGLYSMSFVINILKRKDMVRWGSCVGLSPYFFVMDQKYSWDIDFQEDFDYCESVYKKRQ